MLVFTVQQSKSAMVVVDLVAKSCPTLVTPMDCSLPGSSIHGISQRRILECAISPFRGSSDSGIELVSPASQEHSFTPEPPGKTK